MSLGSTHVLPSCQPTTTCTPCIFGAATSLHSYPYQLETVTVEVIPMVTPAYNGSFQTSYLTTTSTDTLNLTGSQLSTSQITDPGAATWTLFDSLVLTSPTTYVQYTDFYGASGAVAPITPTVSSGAASTCAQWSAVKHIPSPPDAPVAPLLVPLALNASMNGTYWPSNVVPSQMLDYLEEQSWIISAMGNDDLSVCSAIHHYIRPTVCTTESVSTITTCLPSTRLNGTTCVHTVKATTVVATLGLPSGTMSTGGYPRISTSEVMSGTVASLTVPATPSAVPVYPSSQAPGPNGWTLQSTPISHQTVHFLTTITRAPTTETPPPSSDYHSQGQQAPGGGNAPPFQLTTDPPALTSPSTPDPTTQPQPQSDQQQQQQPPPASTTIILIGTHPLPQGSALTQDGTTFSLAPSGTLYINNTPTPLSTPLTLPDLTISPLPLPASALPELIAPSLTLSPGLALTLASTTLSLPSIPDGSLFLNGSPTPLPSLLTVGDVTFTLTSPDIPVRTGTSRTVEGLVGGGVTVLPGEVVTVGERTVSVGENTGDTGGGETVYVDGVPVTVSSDGEGVTVGTGVFSVVRVTEVGGAGETAGVTAGMGGGGGGGGGGGDGGGAIFRATTGVASKSDARREGTRGMVAWWVAGLVAMAVVGS